MGAKRTPVVQGLPPRYMTPAEIVVAREALGVDSMAEMARVLKTPYRTYQDWERGVARPPSMLELTFKLLLIRKLGGLSLCNIL